MATLLDAPKRSARTEEFVDGRIRDVRARLRNLDRASAGLKVAVSGLALIFAYLLVSHWLEVPSWAYALAGLGWLAGAAGYLWYAIYRPSRREINPLFVAHRVERMIPDARNSIVNYVDLHDQERVAAPIRSVISQRAARDLTNIDAERAVESPSFLWLSVVAVAMFVGSLVVLILPPTRTTIEFISPPEGNMTIVSGQDARFEVKLVGRVPAVDDVDAAKMRIWYNPDDAETYEDRPLSLREDTRNQFGLILNPRQTRSGFDYQILAGKAASPKYTLTVRIIPEFVGFEVRYDYPSWQKREPLTNGDPNLVAPYATKIALTARTNRDAASARIVLDNGKVIPGVVSPTLATELKFDLVADVRRPTTYRIEYTTPEGDQNTPKPYRLVVTDPDPSFRNYDLAMDYPAYVRWRKQTFQGLKDAHLEAIRGTKVVLTAHANRPVKSATLTLDTTRQVIPGEVLPGTDVRFPIQLLRDDTFTLTFVPATGEEASRPVKFNLRATSDSAPKVEITVPKEEEISLPANAPLPLEGFSTDDYGIASMTLKMQATTPTGALTELASVAYRGGKSFRRDFDKSYPTRVDYKEVVDLGKVTAPSTPGFLLKEGMVVEYWLEARDNRDILEGPNVGVSARKRVRILAPITEPMPKKNNDEQKEKLDRDKKKHDQQQDKKNADEKREPNQPKQEGDKGENGDPKDGEPKEGDPKPENKQDGKEGKSKESPEPKKGEGKKGSDKNEGKQEDMNPEQSPMPKQNEGKEGKEGKQGSDKKEGKEGKGEKSTEPKQGESEEEKAARELENKLDGKDKPEEAPTPKTKPEGKEGGSTKPEPKKGEGQEPKAEDKPTPEEKGKEKPKGKDGGDGMNPDKKSGDEPKGSDKPMSDTPPKTDPKQEPKQGGPMGQQGEQNPPPAGEDKPPSANNKQPNELERENGGKTKPDKNAEPPREKTKDDVDRLTKELEEGNQGQKDKAKDDLTKEASKSPEKQKEVEDKIDELKKKQKDEKKKEQLEKDKQEIGKKAEENRKKDDTQSGNGGTPKPMGKDQPEPKQGEGSKPEPKESEPKEGDPKPKEGDPKTQGGKPKPDQPKDKTEGKSKEGEPKQKEGEPKTKEGDPKQKEGEPKGKAEEKENPDKTAQNPMGSQKPEPTEGKKGEDGKEGKKEVAGGKTDGKDDKKEEGGPMPKETGKGPEKGPKPPEKDTPAKTAKEPNGEGKKDPTAPKEPKDKGTPPKKGEGKEVAKDKTDKKADGEGKGPMGNPDPKKSGESPAVEAEDPMEADLKNKLKSAELQLEKFKKAAEDDAKLREVQRTKQEMADFIAGREKAVEALKARLAELERNPARGSRSGASGINGGGKVEYDPKAGVDPLNGGRGKVPGKYGDAYKQFTQDGAGVKK